MVCIYYIASARSNNRYKCILFAAESGRTMRIIIDVVYTSSVRTSVVRRRPPLLENVKIYLKKIAIIHESTCSYDI